MNKKVAIIGASGYTGWELIKLLHNRPGVELISLNSESHAGRPVAELYPDADPDLKFTGDSLDAINRMNPDLVFLCQADGFARTHVSKFHCRVIDLSRDLRLAKNAIYGLPELNRQSISTSQLVANPGCYATACILAALPVIKNNLAERIVFDGKSGYSGAGRMPSDRNDPKRYLDNIFAYKITDHPHQPEIQQVLGFTPISFTPHVLPVFRGIMVTSHIYLNKPITSAKIQDLYRNYYAAEPFVKIMERLPELHDVQNNNRCCLGGFEIDQNNRLVVIAAIDNLLKGASGQAVQNMNLMLGFPEAEGLPGA